MADETNITPKTKTGWAKVAQAGLATIAAWPDKITQAFAEKPSLNRIPFVPDIARTIATTINTAEHSISETVATASNRALEHLPGEFVDHKDYELNQQEGTLPNFAPWQFMVLLRGAANLVAVPLVLSAFEHHIEALIENFAPTDTLKQDAINALGKISENDNAYERVYNEALQKAEETAKAQFIANGGDAENFKFDKKAFLEENEDIAKLSPDEDHIPIPYTAVKAAIVIGTVLVAFRPWLEHAPVINWAYKAFSSLLDTIEGNLYVTNTLAIDIEKEAFSSPSNLVESLKSEHKFSHLRETHRRVKDAKLFDMEEGAPIDYPTEFETNHDRKQAYAMFERLNELVTKLESKPAKAGKIVETWAKDMRNAAKNKKVPYPEKNDLIELFAAAYLSMPAHIEIKTQLTVGGRTETGDLSPRDYLLVVVDSIDSKQNRIFPKHLNANAIENYLNIPHAEAEKEKPKTKAGKGQHPDNQTELVPDEDLQLFANAFSEETDATPTEKAPKANATNKIKNLPSPLAEASFSKRATKQIEQLRDQLTGDHRTDIRLIGNFVQNILDGKAPEIDPEKLTPRHIDAIHDALGEHLATETNAVLVNALIDHPKPRDTLTELAAHAPRTKKIDMPERRYDGDFRQKRANNQQAAAKQPTQKPKAPASVESIVQQERTSLAKVREKGPTAASIKKWAKRRLPRTRRRVQICSPNNGKSCCTDGTISKQPITTVKNNTSHG